MKKILFIVILVLLSVTLFGCGDSVREMPMKDTFLYEDCTGFYERNYILYDDEPMSISCTSKITKQQTEISYQQYQDSLDVIIIYNLLFDMIKEVRPSAEFRYIVEMMSDLMLANNFNFTEIGETVVGTLPSYNYSYIVIEVEFETSVSIEFLSIPSYGNFEVDIYTTNSLASGDPDETFDNIVEGQTITVTLHPGFNTIELNNYSSYDIEFIIRVILSTGL